MVSPFLQYSLAFFAILPTEYNQKNLFHIIKEEKSDKKIFPEDSNREELNKIKKSKLRKRLYNLSIDFRSYDDINEKIKSNKSMVPIIKNKNLKSGVIDPSLCFNNLSEMKTVFPEIT